MIRNYLLGLLTIIILLSCKSDKPADSDTYIVNAAIMIALARNNWSNVEPGMNTKTGYQYFVSAPGTGIKAEVHLPALDDSNRIVKGTVLLNIALDNRVQFGMFTTTDTLVQSAAYAMMLNYYNATIGSITGITSSVGELIENGVGGNVAVPVVLSKLTNGQVADQLAITYYCTQGQFSMVIFRQTDGRFIFSYRAI